MLYSTPTEYAIRGLAELALRSPERFILLDDLVRDTDLPRPFMAKVFGQLVRGGILRSVKGRSGGFMPARRIDQITLLEIVEAMEGPRVMDQCVVGLAACNDQQPCAQHDLYKPIRQRLKEYMTTTTLADLAASLRSKKEQLRAGRAVAAEGRAPRPVRERKPGG